MKPESWSSVDSKGTTTIKTQKHSKDIGEIIHVSSVIQQSFYKDTRTFSVLKELYNSNDLLCYDLNVHTAHMHVLCQ